MYNWRISKYNPENRDEAGGYLNNEWTSVSDIGSRYDGRVLTLDEYRSVEDCYVASIRAFLAAADLSWLEVASLEGPADVEMASRNLWNIALDPALVTNGMILSAQSLEDMCRLALREILWCRLISGNDFHIHFGYEYYLYIGSRTASEAAVAGTRRSGLFVEEMISPYMID